MELTEEAEMLLGAGHRSRAYALAHLAHEEIAKCVGLLNIWVGQHFRGVPPQWELFWRKWDKHDFKVQVAIVGDGLRRAVGGRGASGATSPDRARGASAGRPCPDACVLSHHGGCDSEPRRARPATDCGNLRGLRGWQGGAAVGG